MFSLVRNKAVFSLFFPMSAKCYEYYEHDEGDDDDDEKGKEPKREGYSASSVSPFKNRKETNMIIKVNSHRVYFAFHEQDKNKNI